MALKPKPCAHCGKPFRGSDKKQRFCSQDCVTLYKGMRLSRRTCILCGTAYRAQSSTQEYCSNKCATTAHRGANNPSYRGGYTRKDGYRVISVDGRPMLEHRAVMEQHLGRPLARAEVVHHINGNPSDCRIENLMLLRSQADHKKEHITAFRSETHKECSRCHTVKPRSEFVLLRDPTTDEDPHVSRCRQCGREACHRWWVNLSPERKAKRAAARRKTVKL